LEKDAERIPAFCLIDPLKRFAAECFEWGKAKEQVIPRISVPGPFDPAFPEQAAPDACDMVAASALGRRVQALRFALDNLPREAKRLARWKMSWRGGAGQAQTRPPVAVPPRPRAGY
jgi:hypothetical protein